MREVSIHLELQHFSQLSFSSRCCCPIAPDTEGLIKRHVRSFCLLPLNIIFQVAVLELGFLQLRFDHIANRNDALQATICHNG